VNIHELWASADKRGRKQPSLDNISYSSVQHHYRENTSVCSAIPPTRLPCTGSSLATALAASRVRLSGPLAHTPTPPWQTTRSLFSLRLLSSSTSSSTNAGESIRASNWYTSGRVVVTVEFGIAGNVGVSHRQVTKIEIWRSSDDSSAAASAISISKGETHCI
jgi:hypothetical protein